MDNQKLIEQAYQAFNNREIDILLQMMHPDVKWPRAWEGDYAYGHDEAKAYWQRQWKEINPKVTPMDFVERTNGNLEVEADQLVKDLDGNVPFDGKVKHVHIIEDGLIQQMNIEQY